MKLTDAIEHTLFKRVGMSAWLMVDKDDYIVYAGTNKECDLTREDILADDWQVPVTHAPPRLIYAMHVAGNSTHSCDEGTYQNHLDRDVVVKVYSE